VGHWQLSCFPRLVRICLFLSSRYISEVRSAPCSLPPVPELPWLSFFLHLHFPPGSFVRKDEDTWVFRGHDPPPATSTARDFALVLAPLRCLQEGDSGDFPFFKCSLFFPCLLAVGLNPDLGLSRARSFHLALVFRKTGVVFLPGSLRGSPAPFRGSWTCRFFPPVGTVLRIFPSRSGSVSFFP